ncbi:MAG: metallophosphoesterase family protein [Lachnospiraceae bacterium]
MEEAQKQKNRRKFILAVVTAVSLLMLVFVSTLRIHDDYEKDAANAVLNELKVEDSIPLIQTGKTDWRYMDSGMAPAPDSNGLDWTQRDYDDVKWKEGKGTFASVNGKRVDWVNGLRPVNLLNYFTPEKKPVPVYYFRTEFNVDEVHGEWRLDGTAEFDDSLVLYINGRRIYTSNISDTEAFKNTGYGATETVKHSLVKHMTIDDPSVLRKGKNVIAVEVHQASQTSSDIYFDFKEMIYHEFQTPQGMPKAGTVILEPGDTERSVRVNWLVNEKNAYKVEYGKIGQIENNLYNNVTMEQKISKDDIVYCYTATLNNLRPNTKYAYRIASLSESKRSNEFHFETQELSGRFSFLFAGDPQLSVENLKSNLAGWNTTLTVGQSIRPDTAFILSGGDQIDSAHELDALEEYYAFRSPQVLKSIPIATTRGNHEAGTELYDLQFNRLNENSVQDSYFTYNTVLFLNLNSNNNNYWEHRDFLEKTIAKTNPRWIIVNTHYSIFGTGPHSSEEEIVEGRAEFSKLFAEFNVDLVLSGHDHIYTRSYLMNGQTSTGKNGGKKLVGETQYLTGGSSSGSKYYKQTENNPPYVALSVQDEVPAISSIEVSENELRINTYNVMDLKELDSCVITK